MDKEQIIDKTMVTRAVISKINEEKKSAIIKTDHIKEFESPDKVYIKGQDEEYIPDIETIKDDEINLYEIELSQQMHTDKWRLFSKYAEKHNGNLYLVVPDYIKDNVKQVIMDKKINAGLIYFKTE